MAEVTITGLVRTYDNGFSAVKGIDLAIRDREFMVLVGPSGCGKTTTLRMIAGLEEITAGTIAIGGRVINEVEPKDRDIAMVFQSYALYPHMTVAENLAFALTLRRRPKAEIADKIRAAAALLGLTDQLGKLPRQLSGGQRQRVALGRAIVRHPQVFLFDEPLSNLDAKLRGEMRYELKTLQRTLATTMVYVTHDQVEAMTLGDRITVMRQGEIMQVAAPAEIYERPANRFVAAFIGMPMMNFLSGRVASHGDGLALHLAGSAAVVPLTMAGAPRLAARVGQEAVLGIRPEHLAPADADSAGALAAQVRLIENMGDHQYVYLELPGRAEPLVMKHHGSFAHPAGSVLGVRLDAGRGHVFAGAEETAANLTREG
jgi:multiple sugar transport system ATP-binding protein